MMDIGKLNIIQHNEFCLTVVSDIRDWSLTICGVCGGGGSGKEGNGGDIILLDSF
jgi:hypothetical protein